MLIQGCLLISRTLLTDYISRVEGHAGKAITSLVRPSCWDALQQLVQEALVLGLSAEVGPAELWLSSTLRACCGSLAAVFIQYGSQCSQHVQQGVPVQWGEGGGGHAKLRPVSGGPAAGA